MCYAYNAEMLCDDCANFMMKVIDERGYADTGDTNDYPQYSHSDEADSPQHCGHCGEFLYNDLTSDGVDYAKRIILDDLESGCRDSVAVRVWNEFYGLVKYDDCCVCGKTAILDDYYCCEDCSDYDDCTD